MVHVHNSDTPGQYAILFLKHCSLFVYQMLVLINESPLPIFHVEFLILVPQPAERLDRESLQKATLSSAVTVPSI